MNSKPRISVVICTYNRDKWIRNALESTVNQTLDSLAYEVIVVNNKCTDNTEQIVLDFIANHEDFNIRMVLEESQGLSFARNRGIEEANSDIILYMDDDGVADATLFEEIATYMEQHTDVIGIGGKVTPIYEGQPPKWLNPYLIMMVTAIDYGEESFQFEGKKYPPGCNMTYRKSVLQQVGGFNEDLKWRVDDKYIFLKAQEVSKNIRYIPTLNVGHNIDEDRTTDENFDNLSLKLGHDERRRVKSQGVSAYLVKVLEYTFKWVASVGLGLVYAIRGKALAGRYIIRFRWQCLLGLLDQKMFTR